LYNTRSYISISDNSVDIQSSTEHWEASTWQAWAALHPWSDSGPRNLSFSTMIKNVFDRNKDSPKNITEEDHRMAIILTLIRILWSIKEIERNPLSELMQDPSKGETSKKRVLEVLDGFLESPTESLTLDSGLANLAAVHRMQTIHIAHLISAGHMMDWLYSVLRGGPESENARSKMELWASRDPARVRDTIYRSAQILSLIRQYPYNQGQEPLNAAVGPNVLCLDRLESTNDIETVSINAWVQDGGTQVLHLYGVPNLCSKMGRRQVLEQTAAILQRMQVWGIAHNFLDVIRGCIKKEESLSPHVSGP
jgi:hypothetical protein